MQWMSLVYREVNISAEVNISTEVFINVLGDFECFELTYCAVFHHSLCRRNAQSVDEGKELMTDVNIIRWCPHVSLLPSTL